jgi:hypothetical protein
VQCIISERQSKKEMRRDNQQANNEDADGEGEEEAKMEDRCGFSAKISSAALDLSRLFACTARLAAFSASARLLRILCVLTNMR